MPRVQDLWYEGSWKTTDRCTAWRSHWDRALWGCCCTARCTAQGVVHTYPDSTRWNCPHRRTPASHIHTTKNPWKSHLRTLNYGNKKFARGAHRERTAQEILPSAHGCRFCPLASLPCRRQQCFARSLPHDSELPRVLSSTNDAGNVTQGQGVQDHQVLPINERLKVRGREGGSAGKAVALHFPTTPGSAPAVSHPPPAEHTPVRAVLHL